MSEKDFVLFMHSYRKSGLRMLSFIHFKGLKEAVLKFMFIIEKMTNKKYLPFEKFRKIQNSFLQI